VATPTRKPDRARTTENDSLFAAKPKALKDESKAEPIVVKKEVTPIETAPASSQTLARRAQQPADVKTTNRGRRVNPPSIRLPDPELPNNVPARSTESPRAYRMSSVATPIAGPKFYRSADGTQYVKFSDGSTRVIRPAQNTRSGGSYR